MKCLRCGAGFSVRQTCPSCGAPAGEPYIEDLFERLPPEDPNPEPAKSPAPPAAPAPEPAPEKRSVPEAARIARPVPAPREPPRAERAPLAAPVRPLSEGAAPSSMPRSPPPPASAPATPARPAPLTAFRTTPVPVAAAARGASARRATAATEVRVHMAGFWRRALAQVVDVALLAGFFALLLRIGAGPLDLSGLPRSHLWGIDYVVFLLLHHTGQVVPIAVFMLATTFGYYFLFQTILGWTPGKRFFGMRVVDVRGRRIGPVRALLRTLAYGISASFFMMGFLWAAFDLERRALHDVLCGTYVIVGQPEIVAAPSLGTAGSAPVDRLGASRV